MTWTPWNLTDFEAHICGLKCNELLDELPWHVCQIFMFPSRWFVIFGDLFSQCVLGVQIIISPMLMTKYLQNSAVLSLSVPHSLFPRSRLCHFPSIHHMPLDFPSFPRHVTAPPICTPSLWALQIFSQSFPTHSLPVAMCCMPFLSSLCNLLGLSACL